MIKVGKDELLLFSSNQIQGLHIAEKEASQSGFLIGLDDEGNWDVKNSDFTVSHLDKVTNVHSIYYISRVRPQFGDNAEAHHYMAFAKETLLLMNWNEKTWQFDVIETFPMEKLEDMMFDELNGLLFTQAAKWPRICKLGIKRSFHQCFNVDGVGINRISSITPLAGY